MSLVTLIKDYVDVANSSEQLDGYTFSSLAYYTLGFLFSILKQVLVNFCTFQWIRDFSYFCLTPPMLFSSFANINISEGMATKEPLLSNLVAFSETNFFSKGSGIGLIFLGFFNGCFTSMHISAANLITIQRLLVQGVPAGLCSALGTAIGQCFFLACVHFGFRTVLFPWLSVEPLPFLLGMGILLAIASNSAQDRRTPTIQWSAKSFLLIYAFTSLALAWCEQTALFQLMGNLSFGAEPTLLETTPSVETIGTIFENVQQIIKNGSYLLAFFFGNFLGTFFLAYALQRLLELLLSFRGIPIYYGLIKQANLPLATLIFAFGFGSLPYYGFDYLITKGFGFIPQEQLFQQTLFSPVNLVSKTSQTKEPTQGRLEDQLALLFTLEGEKNKSFVVDTTPFDDGHYLKAGQKRPQAFEDLNYRGEHLWTNRLSRISNIKEQANQTQSSFLGPAFSWMRSFLWGEGPTTSNAIGEKITNNANHANFNKNQLKNKSTNDNILENTTKRKKELSVEGEQLDNYVKEFDRQFDKGFSNFHNAEPISLIEVEDQWQEQRIKKKCYTNPIYTFLLNIEIDSFLKRQPNYHQLSAEEEILLLKRRQLLSNYYDTLALTSQIPTSQAFNQLVPKSYTNAIYNHQFKGTLKIARRLFSIKNALPQRNYVSLLQASKNSKNSESSELSSFLTPEGISSTRNSSFSTTKDQKSSKLQNNSVGTNRPLKGIDMIKGNNNTSSMSEIQKIEDLEKARIIKFDQPLFFKEKILSSSGNSQLQNSDFAIPERSEVTEQKKIIFHEELNFDSKRNELNEIGSPNTIVLSEEIANNQHLKKPYASLKPSKLNISEETYESDLPQENDSTVNNQYLATQISKDTQSNSLVQKSIDKNVFLLEQAESLPLYASWDEELRKLILTNRFQSRLKAGYTYSAGQNFPKIMQSQGKDSRSADSLHSDISFTAWPLPNPGNEKNNDSLDIGKRNDNGNNNVQKPSQLLTSKEYKANNTIVNNPLDFKFIQNVVDSLIHTTFHFPSFLFPTQSIESFNYNKEPVPNDMINALLQWQKLIKDNKQLSKEDKQAVKEKVFYWPKNVRRANWSTELMDNDIEFDEPAENTLKKQKILWEFIPPNYGGFIWPGVK